jgi:putative peptidoglycan lipid II flippase
LPTAPQRAALLLATSILLSRLLGYVRDAVLSWQFGATAQTDAYHAAFVLPDMLNYFLAGGALSLAFLPAFHRAQAEGGETRAWGLFWNLTLTTAAIMLLGITMAWWWCDTLVGWLFPGFGPDEHALTVRLTRIVLPGPLFFSLGGLINATQMAGQRFGATSLAPLVYNLSIVAGGTLASPWLGVEGFSWGVIVGAFAGPLLTSLLFARGELRGVRPMPLSDPAVRAYWWAALPLLVGISLTTVDEWFGRWAASGLEDGSITWLNNARRLMLVPVALIGQAVGTATLPFLSARHTAGDHQEFDRTLDRALSLTWRLGFLAAAGLMVSGRWVIDVLYGHGAYDVADSMRTSALLEVLCLAVPAWSAQAVISRAWYAQSRMWAPMLLLTLVAAAVAPLYAWWSAWAVEGIAWATVVGTWLSVVALVLPSRRVSAAVQRSTWRWVPRSALSVVPALAVWWLLARGADAVASVGWTVVSVLLLAVALLVDDELRLVLTRRLRR